MCLHRNALTALVFSVACYAQGSLIHLTLEGVTPTQAVLSYDARDSSACTVRVFETATGTGTMVLVHDVDASLFTRANQDLSRPATIVNGLQRIVTIGARTASVAKDGKLYSRALQAATQHLISVTCSRSSGSLSFQTENPPLGNTYPEAPPFEPAGFGNYGWPTVNWSNPSKTYVDPMTGLLVKPVFGADPYGHTGQWGLDAAEWQFPDAFDLNNAWTSIANISAQSAGGPFASYSGPSSDPVFLPFSPFPNQDSTIAGWNLGAIWDDVRLTLYGYGSDSDPENRKVLACVAAFFAPATNQCTGAEIELTLPANSAGTVTSPGFPAFYFGAWKLRFLTRDQASIPTGTVSVAGSIVTWKSGQYFPLSLPAGVKIKLGATWYTVAGVDSATGITLSEPSVTLSGDVPYQLGGFGIRIRKKTALGSINVNASWTLAWAAVQDNGYNATGDLCSQLTFPVNYQADGVTPVSPPQTGKLCIIGRVNTRLALLIPATGEVRVLSGLSHQDAGSYTYPSVPFGAFSSTDPLTIYGVHGDDQVQDGGYSTLYRITYDPTVCHFRTWPGNNYGFPGGPQASDCVTWTNLTPAKQGRDVITQFQSAVATNPFWNASVMSQIKPSFGGIAGNYGLFSQYFAGGQNTPCFIAAFDVNTGNLVQVTDSFGGTSATLRWGGCHTFPYLIAGNWVSVGIDGLGGGGYLGGPFQIQSIYAVSKDAGVTWSNDTSLTNLDAGTCATTDPTMIAAGATGSRCVKVRINSDYPCSVAPANGDAAAFPCPWNSAYAGPMPLQPGDYISDLGNWYQSGALPGKSEKFLITSKTNIGSANWELELMRWATCDDLQWYTHLDWVNATHANGWLAYMTATKMCASVNAWFNASDTTHTFYNDNGAMNDGHATVGPAPGGMLATIREGGATRIGPSIPGQVGLPPNFTQNFGTTTFAGVTRGAGDDVQNYPNLRQWTAPDAEKAFTFDFHHLNPAVGVGPEAPMGVWRQNCALVPGLKQVYKIDNYGGVFGKVFPYLAFAGRNLLADISGPASVIADKDEWRFCVAYKAGECRPGSVVNDVFVNVPKANVSNSCVVNSYALNSPCFTTPYDYGAWIVQYQNNQDDPAGKNFRRLTMAFTGPGRQYQFSNGKATPEGRWVIFGSGWVDGTRSNLMMVKIPPPPATDRIDRTKFIPVQVTVPGGTVATGVTYARVRFGYAENGPVNSFYCTSRQEACLTDQAAGPFAYEKSDTLTPAPCGTSGCTLIVPALPNRVLYYSVEQLNSDGTVASAGPVRVYATP